MKTKIKAYLGVDLGNSGIKMITIAPDQNGEAMKRISILNNTYGFLPDAKILKNTSCNYRASTSRLFETDSKFICTGTLATLESKVHLEATVSDKKYESVISKYGMMCVYMKAYEDLQDMYGIPMEDMDVEFNLVVLLPASDIDAGADSFKEFIKKITHIKFDLPDFETDIKVNRIDVKSEGLTAYMGVMFDTPADLKQDYEYLLNDTVLVVDIGQGTTDCIVIQDQNIVDSSQMSIDLGSNVVNSTFGKELSKTLTKGRKLSAEKMLTATTTGWVKLGKMMFPEQERLNRIIDNVAMDISIEVKKYIDALNMSVNDIEDVLVCGGTCTDTYVDPESGVEVEPLGRKVCDRLCQLFPYASEVKIIAKEDFNSRILNALGAGILAMNYMDMDLQEASSTEYFYQETEE